MATTKAIALSATELRAHSSQFDGTSMCFTKGAKRDRQRVEGILCAKAFKMGNAAVTAIREEGSNRTTRLFVQYVLRYSSSQRDVERVLPQGARVVLDCPLTLWDGSLCVESPTFMHVVSYYPHYDTTVDHGELRVLGNTQFKAGNYHGALDLYANSIKAAMDAGNRENAVIGYSNRAQVWLKLGEHLKALRDASIALEMDAGHLKSVVRKAKALRGLHHYEASYHCLVQAATMDAKDGNGKEIIGEVQEGTRLWMDSLNGSHDLASHFLGSRKTEAEYSNFVGPVTVAMTRDGRGRGLFATKDVAVGELLVVYNAVTGGQATELLNDGIRACLASPWAWKQVATMVNMAVVPEMQDFYPNVAWWEQSERLRKQQDVEEIVRALCGLHCDGRWGDGVAGFWTLPSMINHSCVANVTTLPVGSVMVVRACRDIPAGGELLRSYVRAAAPYFSWRQNLQFQCKCERCELERSLQAQLEPISKEYSLLIENRRENPEEALQLALRVEDLIRSRELTGEQGDWLRVVHGQAYVLAGYAVGSGARDVLPSSAVLEEATVRLAPGCWLEAMLESFDGDTGVSLPLDEVPGLELLKKEVVACLGPLDDVTMDSVLLMASPCWTLLYDRDRYI